MDINEFVEILKEWGGKNDVVSGTNCIDGCNDCKLNHKVLIGNEINTLCTILCKISKELNSI